MVLPLSALSITFSLAIASACPQQPNPLRELSSLEHVGGGDSNDEKMMTINDDGWS